MLRILQNTPEALYTVAYADDVMILIEGNARTELEQKARYCLLQVQQSCGQNKLELSEGRTCYLMLKGNLLRNLTIKLNQVNINRNPTVRNLGFLLMKAGILASSLTR